VATNDRIEHPAHVGGGDGAALHAEADETASALVHDHEHPIASQHVSVGRRLATRNVAESWIQRENCQTDTLLHWVLALPLAMMRPQAQFPSITGMASSQR
jgi:hypothetical protein